MPTPNETQFIFSQLQANAPSMDTEQNLEGDIIDLYYGQLIAGTVPFVASAVGTATAAAGMGGTPPTIGNPAPGNVNFGSGTTPAAGVQMTFLFGTALPAGITPQIFLQPLNDVTAQLRLVPTAISNTGFSISAGVAPAASQAAGTYAFAFHVIA